MREASKGSIRPEIFALAPAENLLRPISKIAKLPVNPLNIVKCQRLQNNFAQDARQKI